jgi:signal transduction histidine kinase
MSCVALIFLPGVLAHADGPHTRRLLSANEDRRNLDAEISLLRDPARQLGIADVAAPAMRSRFQVQDRGLSLGVTDDVVWVRIALQREATAPDTWWLEASNAVIDDYRLYVADEHGHGLLAQAGDRQPSDAQPVYYRHPVLPVVLPDERARVFYLRIESRSAIHVSLDLWQPQALLRAAQPEQIAIGLMFGLMSTTALLNFLNGAVMRDARYPLFALSCLFVGETVGAELGLVSQYVFPRAPLIVDTLNNVNVCLMPAVMLLALRQLPGVVSGFSPVDRCAGGLTLVCTLAALGVMFDLLDVGVVGPLMLLLALVSVLAAAAGGWRSCLDGRPGAPVFLAGILTFLLPFSVAIAAVLGVLDIPAWVELLWMISIVLFCALAHLGLLLDVHLIRKDRLAAANANLHSRTLAERERVLREEQTVFFSYVAHELRNPLGIIISGLANLRAGFADAGDDVLQRIGRITSAARRMSGLIDRHLRLQRMAHADFDPDFNECSPSCPASEAYGLVSELHPERTVEYTAATDLPTAVSMDVELVTLALVNLLDNAVKYSPPGSPVRLEVRCDAVDSGEIAYRVTDKGKGLAEKDRSRLFRVYAREPGNASAGFGIGLALVANVARHHGGSIEYIPHPEAGAAFELRIPIRLSPTMECP